ncbi:calcium-activated chloride channel-domain-containing protein [Mortierella sp. GBAus27b]|nr:Anoctamin-7 [Mortierella sp. GBA43]KAI8355375.1 calcium-activated chloride channel-domain-containing protein [Mortierella sp. GBAus27b]
MNPNSRDDSAVVNLAALTAQGSQPQKPSGASSGDKGGSKDGQHQGSGKGKKECPRHAEGHSPNKLTTRDLGDRQTVYLFYGSDVTLFDTIKSYKHDNPDKRVEDAIDAFSEQQGSDALANIIYGTQAFDMIFKYPIPEHLRKVPDTPPVIGLHPTVSDIEIDSTSSGARARKEEKHRRLQEEKRLEVLAASLKDEKKDIETGTKDPLTESEARLERIRTRFRKALLRENLVIEEEPHIDGEVMYMKVYAPFWRLCIEAQRLRSKMELAQFDMAKERADTTQTSPQGLWARTFRRFLHKFDNVTLPLRTESLLFKASKLRQYALAERNRKWSDIVRHGGGVKPDGTGMGSNMGSDGKDGFFGTGRRGNLIESIIIYCKIRSKRTDRYALRYAMDRKAITDMYTLHDGSYKSKVQPTPNTRTLLYQSWARSRDKQPLEEIRFYYGEKIALYFAWIGHYTKWLVYASIVGFLFLIYGIVSSVLAKKGQITQIQSGDLFDNALTMPYAIFVAVWSSLFVEHWKRKSNVLAYQWNTLDFEQRERARPEFKPTAIRTSPVTGKKELYYPRYKQIFSIVISVLVVLISIAIVTVSVGSLLLFNVWLKNHGPGSPNTNSYAITAITAVMNLVVILILGTGYASIAKVLTDNENHRRLTQYEDSLIIKRFLFDFVNFYSALVYIAFFKGNVKISNRPDLQDSCGDKGFCMGELRIQLAIVFIGKQLLNQFQEVAIPQLKAWWNSKSELAEKAKLATLKGKYKEKNMVKPPQWAKDDLLPPYDNSMFEEYRELVIQFGFCTLFVPAFPVAPIFALLNNVLEIRLDAYKLLTQHRRPVSQATQDIGSWTTILTVLSYLSVITNACLIAYQSDWMYKNIFEPAVQRSLKITTPITGIQDAEQQNRADDALLIVRLLFIFIFEHVVFILKFGISGLIRDMPRPVKLAIERESYYTRLALNDEEPAIDEELEEGDASEDESDEDEEVEWYRRFKRHSGAGDHSDNVDEKDAEGTPEELAEIEENDEELEALIKAGGCGCASHNDGIIGTSKGGMEGTWMNRFKPETQAALRRRQKRRRKQNAAKANA